jgi:hypothetical protein
MEIETISQSFLASRVVRTFGKKQCYFSCHFIELTSVKRRTAPGFRPVNTTLGVTTLLSFAFTTSGAADVRGGVPA